MSDQWAHLGSMVFYHSQGRRDGTGDGTLQPWLAWVIGMPEPPGELALFVISPGGGLFSELNVPHSAAPAAGHWSWPTVKDVY